MKANGGPGENLIPVRAQKRIDKAEVQYRGTYNPFLDRNTLVLGYFHL
jgi:hypothetical protein